MKEKNKKEEIFERDEFENLNKIKNKAQTFNIDDILKKILESRK